MRDPFIITEQTAISFSGGRTSAYMLWRVLQSNGGKLLDDAIVCFANTGKEMEATLRFVQACSDNWGVPITWLEYRDDDQGYAVVDFATASRNGEPFEALISKKNYLPNPVTRFCTVEMKIKPISKYLNHELGFDGGCENDAWVGIRADEPLRIAKVGLDRCPLAIAGITKRDVGLFWNQQSFDLELPNNNGTTMHGNCDLCFLKGASQVFSLIKERPERAIWWMKQEERIKSAGQFKSDGARFRSDRPSYAAMYDQASKQVDFIGFDDESIGCFCGD